MSEVLHAADGVTVTLQDNGRYLLDVACPASGEYETAVELTPAGMLALADRLGREAARVRADVALGVQLDCPHS